MKTTFKVVWLLVFLSLTYIGVHNTITMSIPTEIFKWCCFASVGATMSIVIVWSLIHKYFDKCGNGLKRN